MAMVTGGGDGIDAALGYGYPQQEGVRFDADQDSVRVQGR